MIVIQNFDTVATQREDPIRETELRGVAVRVSGSPGTGSEWPDISLPGLYQPFKNGGYAECLKL